MLIRPDGRTLASKREETLTRQQVKLLQDFEAMTQQMGLQFWMRCRACLERGDPDGVWGNNETTATQYVVECSCTKRIYRGADVKLQ